jgi:hypothetical protein
MKLVIRDYYTYATTGDKYVIAIIILADISYCGLLRPEGITHTLIIISDGGLLRPEGINHTVIIISDGGLLRPEGITHTVIIISDVLLCE